MQRIDSRYAWVGQDESGQGCMHNVAIELAPTDPVPQDLIAPLQLGHGARVSSLGPRPRLLAALMTREGMERVARAMDEALPEDTPRTTMVHVGLQTKLDQQPGNESASSIMLTVMSHDPVASRRASEAIQHQASVVAQQRGTFTMRQLLDSGALRKCDAKAEMYRAHLTDLMADALNSAMAAHLADAGEAPEDAVGGVSHVIDVAQTTVHQLDSDRVVVALDANVGPAAVVFHSPGKGLSMIFPKDADQTVNFLPASDGRTVSYSADGPGIPVQEAMVRVANEARQAGLGSVTTCHLPGDNCYINVDAHESTYCRRSRIDLFQLTSGSKLAASSASLFTLVPGVQNIGGTLYGHVQCSTIEQLIRYTDRGTDSVLVPNETSWRDQLVDLDPDKASYNLMTGANAVANTSNKVVSHRLAKAQLSALLDRKNR
jgi:hypothetical protein